MTFLKEETKTIVKGPLNNFYDQSSFYLLNA